MNKLVTRLREPSNSGEGCKHLVLDAADEIERLLESRVPEALPGHRHELVKMGSTIPCARCGGQCVEFTVPNDVWNAVVRRGGKERDDEYMCEACYRRAVEVFVLANMLYRARLIDALRSVLHMNRVQLEQSLKDMLVLDARALLRELGEAPL